MWKSNKNRSKFVCVFKVAVIIRNYEVTFYMLHSQMSIAHNSKRKYLNIEAIKLIVSCVLCAKSCVQCSKIINQDCKL